MSEYLGVFSGIAQGVAAESLGLDPLTTDLDNGLLGSFGLDDLGVDLGNFGLDGINISNIFGDSEFDLTGITDDLFNFDFSSIDFNNLLDAGFNQISDLIGIPSDLITKIDKTFSKISDFESFAGQSITVIPKDIASIINLVGGVHENYNQLKQKVEIAPIKLKENNQPHLTGSVPISYSGDSSSRIPNPLRNCNHYNYIITLGILDKEEFNNPLTYRNSGGFKRIIFKSAGGQYDIRQQIAAEGPNEHAEYFIDNLELESVVAPNKKTSVTLGTNLTFTVIEPYSMGNFIQSLIAASKDYEYESFNDAPFCIKIEFMGWNEYGDRFTDQEQLTKPAYIPIKLITMDFNVTGKGSEYQVQAIPYPEEALGSEADELKTTVKSSGNYVYEILTKNVNSVVNSLNDRIRENEDSGTQAAGDRYVICFPHKEDGVLQAIQSEITPQSYVLNVEKEVQTEKGLESTIHVERANVKQESLNTIKVPVSSNLFEKLFNYATDTNYVNEIGFSSIIQNTAESRIQTAPALNASRDNELDINKPGEAEMSSDQQVKSVHFHAKDKITSVIEQVVLQSDYCLKQATAKPVKGQFKWFKIDTMVFIEDNQEAKKQLGRFPKIYVYCVNPFFADEAKFMSGTNRPNNTQGLIDSAAKEYNYIYTGKNEDVLNFDITFNNAFIQETVANFGNNSGPNNAGLAKAAHSGGINEVQKQSKLPEQQPTIDKKEPSARIAENAALNKKSSGTESIDVRHQIAEMFHYRLTNQMSDMITVEMTIQGDPFFIPQQLGNYVAKPKEDAPGVTVDEKMSYSQNEVMIVVNFRTPFDYQVQGATMEFPEVVSQFSGLFMVWAVTNTFSKGQFTQVLKLIRRRGQDDEGTVNEGFLTIPKEQPAGES